MGFSLAPWSRSCPGQVLDGPQPLRLGMAVINREGVFLLAACLTASLLKLSALVEADEDDDAWLLPFHHKAFLVLPVPAPLYLSR